jgi:ribosome-associated protein
MDEHDTRDQPSKTQRKREMHERQDIGEELVALSEARLTELGLPERLLDAVLAAKRIARFGALRRQLQYVGRLMRDVDAEAIARRLDEWKGRSRQETAHLHALERWRERLLASDEALEDLARAYPGCDLQRVRALVRNARGEQARAAAPASYRELFRELRSIIPEA